MNNRIIKYNMIQLCEKYLYLCTYIYMYGKGIRKDHTKLDSSSLVECLNVWVEDDNHTFLYYCITYLVKGLNFFF